MAFPLHNPSPTPNPDGGCAGAGDQAPQALGAQSPLPPQVIRGTSTQGTGETEGSSPSLGRPTHLLTPRTKVDYLTISCKEDIGAIYDCLGKVFAGAPANPEFESGPGMRHFAYSIRITVAGVPCGAVLFGGGTQRDRACVDLSGSGCSFVTDWPRAEGALLDLPAASWRRGDIAADFFKGEVTHERVKCAHADGKFKRGGRGPKLYEIISSDEEEPRTIYIGKRGGDALGRFYEKGKKLYWESGNRELRAIARTPFGFALKSEGMNGDEYFDLAAWYRAELELRSKNRAIPRDWISRRDEYFAGTYPFLEELMPDVSPEAIVRPRDLGILAIERALDVVKQQWGATFFTALEYMGGDYVALATRIIGHKHSPRLVASGALLALDNKRHADAQSE